MNGTFSALMSTNEVYRDTDRTRCLTLDIEDLEAAVDELDTGKAEADHTHTVNTDQLWSGVLLMDASQNIIPTKKLSECNHGWTLLWSDADIDSDGVITANNFNFVHTPILKKNHTNAEWGGSNHMFAVPSYSSTDGATLVMSIKQLTVYDDKLIGNDANALGTPNKDVVLRVVYEF